MKHPHKCQRCGKEFFSKKKNTKFCSAYCGNMNAKTNTLKGGNKHGYNHNHI